MSNLVYCSFHAIIRNFLKMFREIPKIAQDYDKVHPTRAIEETIFFQIWEVMEKIGVPCNTREPYHHKGQEYNDLNYGKSDGSASYKILVGHHFDLFLPLRYLSFPFIKPSY